MRVLAALLLFALPAFAAPVPKAKAKTTEQKLIGKWKMVVSDTPGGRQGYEFYVVFKEKGEFELRYEYDGDIKPRVYKGTYKVIGDDKIDYSVDVGGRAQKTEILTIDKLTDTEVSWTDPDKLKESLERVKEEEPKNEEKKDK
jgi:uncharacterized protein (TIGR03066 family)